jgi:hypothetical protein
MNAKRPRSSSEPLLWPGDHTSEAENQTWRDRCAEH